MRRRHPLIEPIRNILILRGGAFGDVVLTIPAIERIHDRFPDARITVVGESYSGQALVGHPAIDELIYMHSSDPKAKYLAKLLALRRRHFDLVIDLQGSGRSRLQTFVIGGRNRMGLDRPGARAWAFSIVGPYRVDRHKLVNMLTYLEPIGIKFDGDYCPINIPIKEEHVREARELIQKHQIRRPFVVVHASYSERPAHEEWPRKNFVDLISMLKDRGYDVVLTSSAREAENIESLCQATGGFAKNLAGKTAPLVLAALLREATLYFGYNTGPMHVAAAVDTPIVALFEEPSKYPVWYPWTRARFEILIPDLSAPNADGASLYRADSITPEQVAAAIDRVLAAPVSPEPSSALNSPRQLS